jgi:hypothetical protein
MHRGARRRWSSLVGAAACTLREAMRERFSAADGDDLHRHAPREAVKAGGEHGLSRGSGPSLAGLP